MVIANAGSAYAKLHAKNRELVFGKRCRDDEDGHETVAERVAKVQPPVKKRKISAKPKKAAPKPLKKAPEPMIENWRPAGGDVIEKPRSKKNAEVPTTVLGIARIATWRLENFMEAVQTLIEKHSELEDLVTRELVHGGESVTDIWAEFESEETAEAVKEKIDGEIIYEKKLQVKFA